MRGSSRNKEVNCPKVWKRISEVKRIAKGVIQDRNVGLTNLSNKNTKYKYWLSFLIPCQWINVHLHAARIPLSLVCLFRMLVHSVRMRKSDVHAWVCMAVGRSGAEVKPYITSFKVSCSQPACLPLPFHTDTAQHKKRRKKTVFTEGRLKEKDCTEQRGCRHRSRKDSLTATLCLKDVAQIIGSTTSPTHRMTLSVIFPFTFDKISISLKLDDLCHAWLRFWSSHGLQEQWWLQRGN